MMRRCVASSRYTRVCGLRQWNCSALWGTLRVTTASRERFRTNIRTSNGQVSHERVGTD
jgi:hypothetical protein